MDRSYVILSHIHAHADTHAQIIGLVETFGGDRHNYGINCDDRLADIYYLQNHQVVYVTYAQLICQS